MLHSLDWVSVPLAIFSDAWMMSGEEGKLLAGAAGFYFTLGERTEEQGHRILRSVSLVMQKRNASHCPLVPAFRFTPIRVREKRMNTLKTAKTGRSYQNVNK